MTRQPKKTIGLLLLAYSRGDIKAILDEYEEEELIVEDFGDTFLKKVKFVYHDYIEIKLPSTIEECLYDKDVVRRNNEPLNMYLSRRENLWAKLKKKGGIEFPAQIKGYITLRDAHLSARAWDTLTTWTQGAYDYVTLVDHMRKLERPIPGKPGSATLFQDDQFVGAVVAEDEPDFVDENEPCFQLVQSLYVSAENFLGDEALEEDLEQHMYDEDVNYLAGDVPNNTIFSEDQALAVCANWAQTRQYLHKERLNRGFIKQKPLPPTRQNGGAKGGGKGGGKSKTKTVKKNRFSKLKKWELKFK